MSESDIKFMGEAMIEAAKGLGLVAPNPLVGAVIVKEGRIVARGFHSKCGQAHAELDAINNASCDLKGATLFCNLEPCCHTNKKTPPCVPIIIASGISRVVIANLDPNPAVSGKGILQLRENNIEVTGNVLKVEGEKLNEIFFYHIINKKIFINLKAAQTLDGHIQSISGDSKWISNEDCRKEAHELRLKYDGIFIGRNTLNNDDPRLNIRMGINSKNKIPLRIILGSPHKFNWDSYILNNNLDKNFYLVPKNSLSTLDKEKLKTLSLGHIIEHESLEKSLKELYNLNITSLLVEGGSKVLSTFLKEEAFNKLTIFQAPILLGKGFGILDKESLKISDSIELKLSSVKNVNGNIKVELDKLCSQE